jgi:hypothetical protein
VIAMRLECCTVRLVAFAAALFGLWSPCANRVLYLYSNNLSGTIPSSFGRLTALR